MPGSQQKKKLYCSAQSVVGDAGNVCVKCRVSSETSPKRRDCSCLSKSSLSTRVLYVLVCDVMTSMSAPNLGQVVQVDSRRPGNDCASVTAFEAPMHLL